MGGSGQFSVCRSATPVGELLSNMAREELTGGLSNMSAAFGNKKKLCMELVTKTGEEINALGL